MEETYFGHIVIWPIGFEPRNWAYCGGQIISISENTALYSLLGDKYGGDGRATFGLPDLRSRVPIGAEMANTNPTYFQPPLDPDLTTRYLSMKGGVETVKLSIAEMPTHNHNAEIAVSVTSQPDFEVTAVANCVIGSGTQTNNPSLNFWAEAPGATAAQAASYDPGPANSEMNSAAISAFVTRTANVVVSGEIGINDAGGGGAFEIVQPYLPLNFCICIFGAYPSRN